MADAANAVAQDGDNTLNLSDSPTHLIHRAQQFAADRYAQAFVDSPVTQRQFAVLNAVAANEGLTQTDLVRATGIDRSTLAELVARMSRRGLILRQKAVSDARANTVRLTKDGRAALDEALPLVHDTDAAVLDALPKAKRAAFIESLQRIARVLDEQDAPAEAAPTERPKKAKAKPAKKSAKTAKAPKADKAVKATKKTAKATAKPDKKPKGKAGKGSKKA